jgi:hypothetical protein
MTREVGRPITQVIQTSRSLPTVGGDMARIEVPVT